MIKQIRKYETYGIETLTFILNWNDMYILSSYQCKPFIRFPLTINKLFKYNTIFKNTCYTTRNTLDINRYT